MVAFFIVTIDRGEAAAAATSYCSSPHDDDDVSMHDGMLDTEDSISKNDGNYLQPIVYLA